VPTTPDRRTSRHWWRASPSSRTATWRDAIAADPHFAASETPHFVARGIAALAADPDVISRSGQALGSWQLGRDYGVRDLDGSRPDWGAYFARTFPPPVEHDPAAAS